MSAGGAAAGAAGWCSGAGTGPHEVEGVELLLLLRLLRLDRGQARLHHTVHRIVYAWCYHKLHALVARG